MCLVGKLKGERQMWWYSLFANFSEVISIIRIKSGWYLVFQLPNGDGEIQYFTENTKVTVFIQKIYYCMVLRQFTKIQQ